MSTSSVDHAPAVYWFWHSIPDQETIERQLHEMAAAGIRTFYIQARSAMPRQDYLSAAYFSAYRFAMQVAAHLGMTAGIYDDYNWDSGQAAGRTVQLDPAARERHLFWMAGKIAQRECQVSLTGIQSLMYSEMGDGILDWIYEDGKQRWGEWQIFKVLAFADASVVDFERGVIDVTRYARIDGVTENSCSVKVQLPSDLDLVGYKLIVFVSGCCLSSRLINYLSKKAVAAYVAADYEPYRAEVGEFFGTTIQSIFFDHPYAGYYGWQEKFGEIGNSLMFTPEFPALFMGHYGYPLEKSLLSFLVQLGPATPKLRADFFDLYGQTGREAFFGTVRNWAHQNGLSLTGHELLAHVGAWGYKEGFDFLDARTNYGADYFAIDRYRDITAVDACNYHAQISPKIGDSVAKASGRRGCSIEQYAVALDTGVPGGAGQWGLTLSELRSQAIRHALLGASQFIFHAYYQTDGQANDLTLYRNARFDFAPGLNYEPWFAQYPAFSHELQDLTDLLQTAKPEVPIAVLFPLRTWWAEDQTSIFSRVNGEWFQFLVENSYGFDVISEEQLENAQIENGELVTGDERYKVLLFAGVSTLKSQTALLKVREFARSGGSFVASNCLPRATQVNGEEPELTEEFSEILNSSLKSRYFARVPEREEFSSFLAGAGISGVTLEGAGSSHVWIWSGNHDGKPLVIFFNDSDQFGSFQTYLPLAASFRPYQVDLHSGVRHVYGAYCQNRQNLELEIALQPNEIQIFEFTEEYTETVHLLDSSLPVEAIIDHTGALLLRLAPADAAEISIRVACNGNLHAESDGTNLLSILPADHGQWKVHLPPRNTPQVIAISDWRLTLPRLFADRRVDISRGWETQGGGEYAGQGIYQAEFMLNETPADGEFSLSLPRVETTASVTINGHSLGGLGWAPYRWQIPLEDLHLGRNEIMVSVWNTAANYYYAGTPYQPLGKLPSGLIGAPIIELNYPFYIKLTQER